MAAVAELLAKNSSYPIPRAPQQGDAIHGTAGGVGGSLSHSSAVVYSPVVVSQYQKVRDFHRLMARWVQDPAGFPFASSWIQALTGVDNVKERVAHDMIVQQVERAHGMYPTLFQMPGGRPTRGKSEVSSRVGSTTTNTTSALPTDSTQLEEALVCHLSASYLCTWSMLRERPQNALSGGSPSQSSDKRSSVIGDTTATSEDQMDAATSVVTVPLPLRPTPTDLTAVPPAPPRRPPLSGHRRGGSDDGGDGPWSSTVPTRPSDNGNVGASGNQKTRYVIDMSIARSVCRPGAAAIQTKAPPLVEAVQTVLKQHTQQTCGASSSGALSQAAAAPREPLHSFTLDDLQRAKRQYAENLLHRQQQEALLESLRSPRSKNKETSQHAIHYDQGSVDAAGASGAASASRRRPHTAGTSSAQSRATAASRRLASEAQQQQAALVYGSTTHRAAPLQAGVIAAGGHVPVRPFSAKTTSSWSSRLVVPTGGGSATVVLPL